MKNAKKSMFITTILMVAVLIVAVSTATFAWYTASNTGSATTAVVTSASASDANIAVGWTADAETTSIVFNGSQTVSPMVPNAALATDQDISSITFQTANISTEGEFGTPGTATPWTVDNALIANGEGTEDDVAAGTYDSFFVINHNINAGATVTVKANISGDLSDMLLIAVFVNGKLEGILTNMSAYRVGPVVGGDVYTDLADSTNYLVAAGTGFTFDLEAKGNVGNSAEITLAAWLDGESLVSSKAGQNAAFDLSFTAAPKA